MYIYPCEYSLSLPLAGGIWSPTPADIEVSGRAVQPFSLVEQLPAEPQGEVPR